ncbi:MAG: endo-1,4-beta-xylanase [Armatimonadota bacterium]|nr:endo-1,4-beta-xylanase [Armatimonadota bacterium]
MQRLIFCLTLFGILSVVGFAAPVPPTNLLAGAGWTLMTPTPAEASFETVSVPDAPGGAKTALRLTVNVAQDPFYKILLAHTLALSLPEGTRLRLSFWARSATNNPIRAVVEKDGPPYNAVMDATPMLTPAWKQFTLTGTAPAYGPNGLGVKFQVGQQAGVIELAGITLENLGVDPQITAAQQAVLPGPTQARIRKYRMADLSVIVHDAKGRSIPNARVSVRQTRHAFLFGSNIFALTPDDTSAAQKAYQQRFAALFNYATLPFYWGSFESTQGKPDYARLDGMARWCLAHGITPKGHPLVWHDVYPAWAPKDPDAAIPLLHKRTTDLVTHYRS